MTLAFGYVRASTLDEVKQGSNERQKEEILRYAHSNYDIEFFEDKAKSGKNTQRPEFERMLKSLDRKPKLIIVSKIDRSALSCLILISITCAYVQGSFFSQGNTTIYMQKDCSKKVFLAWPIRIADNLIQFFPSWTDKASFFTHRVLRESVFKGKCFIMSCDYNNTI